MTLGHTGTLTPQPALTAPSNPSWDSPVRASSRFVSMDALRGFAIFGILFRNVFAFGIPPLAYSFPSVWNGDSASDILAWAFIEIYVEGTMRALMSLLFGATAMLLLMRIQTVGLAQVDLYFRRLVIFMAFGLFHSFVMLSTFDILFVYGLVGLFLFPLKDLSAKALIGLAAFGLLLSALAGELDFDASLNIKAGDTEVVETTLEATEQFQAEQSAEELDPDEEPQAGSASPDDPSEAHISEQLTSEQLTSEPGINAVQDALSARQVNEVDEDSNEEIVGNYLAPTWATEITERQQGYVFNMISLAEISLTNLTTELFLSHFLDVITMFLIGMAMVKLDILSGNRPGRFYLWLSLAGYGLGISVNAVETFTDFLFVTQSIEVPGWTSFSYDAGRVGTALGHLGLIIMICKSRHLFFVTDLLAASGRLALTNYLIQTLICTSLFFGFGLGLYGELGHLDLLIIALVIGLTQLIASRIYLMVFHQGPAEWLLRRLCQGKWGIPAPAPALALDHAVHKSDPAVGL